MPQNGTNGTLGTLGTHLSAERRISDCGMEGNEKLHAKRVRFTKRLAVDVAGGSREQESAALYSRACHVDQRET